MNRFFLRKIIPRIAGVIAVILVHQVPSLEGAEEAVTSAILAVWGIVEIALAKNQADREELIARDQRTLRAESLYAGKIDGKYGPKTSAGVRGSISTISRESLGDNCHED